MLRPLVVVMVLVLMIGIAGCAPGPNEFANTPDDDGQVAGFMHGFWQGLISPITFIISLFFDTVHVYEVHNNGGWYNFGFMFGASLTLGGSGGGAARRRR